MVHAVFEQSKSQLIPNNEVYHLEQDGHDVLVHSHRYTFKARTVLLCTNAYSARMHPYFVGKVIPNGRNVW
ncbi:MAG UNVERIFIED_CONTAM: hypothetical protein LVT10_06030 [Anaerolineae bacterium]